MLSEKPVRQPGGGALRRWFADQDLDLIVWLDSNHTIIGFQLCYDRSGTERALTWSRNEGYSHNRIDDGEDDPTKNQSPLLVHDGSFEREKVAHLFEENAEDVPAEIRVFVSEKLHGFES